jgi:hypothetical protein
MTAITAAMPSHFIQSQMDIVLREAVEAERERLRDFQRTEAATERRKDILFANLEPLSRSGHLGDKRTVNCGR